MSIAPTLICHNPVIDGLLQPSYTKTAIEVLEQLLYNRGTFDFHALSNGLFPAAGITSKNQFTNYDKVWVRDNIYIAFSFFERENYLSAGKVLFSISDFFYKYRAKFEEGRRSPDIYKDPMKRPHIRFNGSQLEELKEKWAHAENDALGYFCWLFARMAGVGQITPRTQDFKVLSYLVHYFAQIRFWEDEDSGHWEETRKIEASSIGTVTTGLTELFNYIKQFKIEQIKQELPLISLLVDKGKTTLIELLPKECIQADPLKYRETDAALLFLIYPLGLFQSIIPDKKLEAQILSGVLNQLKGEIGICRYLGDSFWTADTKKKQAKSEITADYSERIQERNRQHQRGQEAQWCIFDPIVSCIYGKYYQTMGNSDYLKLQTSYLNRSLAQLSGEECPYGAFKCPELYYLENGSFTWNDTVPLLWTQANLSLAILEMKRSLA